MIINIIWKTLTVLRENQNKNANTSTKLLLNQTFLTISVISLNTWIFLLTSKTIEILNTIALSSSYWALSLRIKIIKKLVINVIK